MDLFSDESVNLNALRKKAFNYRWAEVEEGVIPLTAADPDFPCAPEIQQAMRDYIDDGYFSYAPKLGLASFKSAFVQAVRQRKGEDIDENLVLPLDSAARCMFVIAQTFLKPGDEMIVFDPCDFLFREACLSAGATPVSLPVPLDREKRRMDFSHLEDVITPHTKMIGLCNPHNPYGLVYTREDLDFILSLCEKHDLLILNDEIWSDIIYPDAQFTSIYRLGNERCKRVLSVFGFSKSFGLAGLRIGCVYATDPDRFQKVVECSSVLTTAGGASSLSQVAASAAMTSSYYWVDAFIRHLTTNRDEAVDFINALPCLKAYRPQGTYLLYVDISQTGLSGAQFVQFMKDKERLALIPGGHEFFGDQSEGHIRICIATSHAVLREGLHRLEAGMRALTV